MNIPNSAGLQVANQVTILLNDMVGETIKSGVSRTRIATYYTKHSTECGVMVDDKVVCSITTALALDAASPTAEIQVRWAMDFPMSRGS